MELSPATGTGTFLFGETLFAETITPVKVSTRVLIFSIRREETKYNANNIWFYR